MKKLLVFLIVALMATGMVFAEGQKETSQVTLSLGHGAPPSNPRHTVAQKMAEWVEEESDGMLKIEIVPSETLGSDRQMAESVGMGTLDLSINSQGPVSTFNPKMAAIGLPFLFETPEDAYRVLDGEIGQDLAEPLLDDGIRVLSYWDNGFRHITNNKRPINKPADLDGLKIRTPEDKITLAIFKTLGANPAPLAFGELPLALSQGVFDGQENPITNIYFAKLYEVQKYISLTGHKYEMCPLIVSEDTWQKLSADQQNVLQEAAQKFAVMHREENNKMQDELLGELEKEGMESNQAQVKLFREATKSVYETFKKDFGADFVDQLVEAASK
ncbi:MAG: DctP family TRAP transporter solute-binding subunit [Spirochaetales bacterium]|nr:DctP family TRAP transporter solute-binding subunit [Spirochaetales bacterium]